MASIALFAVFDGLPALKMSGRCIPLSFPILPVLPALPRPPLPSQYLTIPPLHVQDPGI